MMEQDIEYKQLIEEKKRAEDEHKNADRKFVSQLRKYYFKCLQKEDDKSIKNIKLIGKVFSCADEDECDEYFDEIFFGVIEFQRLSDGDILKLAISEHSGVLIGGSSNTFRSVYDYLGEKFPDFETLKEEFLMADEDEDTSNYFDKCIDKTTGINRSIKFVRNRIKELEKNGAFDHLSMQDLNEVFGTYFEMLRENYPDTLYDISYDNNEFIIEMKHKIKPDSCNPFLKNFKFYWNAETKRVEAYIDNFTDGIYFSDRIPNTLELRRWIYEMDRII